MTCRRRIALLAVALAVASGAPRPVAADDDEEVALSPEARAHMDRGLAEYEARSFRAAAVEFQAAYAIEPRREILFVWAQAERLAGDCDAAAVLYRKFLSLDPPEDEAAKARARLADCEATAGAAAAPPVTTPLPAPAPAAPVEPRRPWYGDGLGAALIVSGVLVAGTGAALVVSARGEPDADDYRAYDRQAASADRRHWIGIGGVAAGGVLLAAGAIRLFVGGTF